MDSTYKHDFETSPENRSTCLETREFNLSQAQSLRCSGSQLTSLDVCGTCESCTVRRHFSVTTAWFRRASYTSQYNFMYGLIERLNSISLLSNLDRLLRPLMCKDVIYAVQRGCATTATKTPRDTMDVKLVDYATTSGIWMWFQTANYWSKAQFLLITLKLCQSDLLYEVSRLVSKLLSAEFESLKAGTADVLDVHQDVGTKGREYFESHEESNLKWLYSVWNTVHPGWEADVSLSTLCHSIQDNSIKHSPISGELLLEETVNVLLISTNNLNKCADEGQKGQSSNEYFNLDSSLPELQNPDESKLYSIAVKSDSLTLDVRNDQILTLDQEKETNTSPDLHTNFDENRVDDLDPIKDLLENVSGILDEAVPTSRSISGNSRVSLSSASLGISSASSSVHVNCTDCDSELTPHFEELQDFADYSKKFQSFNIEAPQSNGNGSLKVKDYFAPIVPLNCLSTKNDVTPPNIRKTEARPGNYSTINRSKDESVQTSSNNHILTSHENINSERYNDDDNPHLDQTASNTDSVFNSAVLILPNENDHSSRNKTTSWISSSSARLSNANSRLSSESSRLSSVPSSANGCSNLSKVPQTASPIESCPSSTHSKDFEVSNKIDESTKKLNRKEGSRTSQTATNTCTAVSRAHFNQSDFIRCLPVHLSKYILSLLDQPSRSACLSVSRQWRILVKEVVKEKLIIKQLRQEFKLMQGSMILVGNPTYANDVMVAVPNIIPKTWQIATKDDVDEEVETEAYNGACFGQSYPGCKTRNVLVEERNEYCGPYNVLVVTDRCDSSRVISMDHGKLIAIGSEDKRVKIINSESNQVLLPLISGHVASVTCVKICEKQGFVMSGSFDTTIRKWSLATRKCLRIYQGHSETVNVLSLGVQYFASGSQDRSCKVWDYEYSKCLRTLKHKAAVTAVHISDAICVSGCLDSTVKVWHLKTGNLIKRLKGHRESITAIVFDQWHIVTSSLDCFVHVWSAQGDYSKCLTALRHPKEVLCLAFKYMRAISGCEDGKIRVWNIVTGQCLRILRGNSNCDSITQLIAVNQRLLVNTRNSTLLLKFEPVEYDYVKATDVLPTTSFIRPTSTFREPRHSSSRMNVSNTNIHGTNKKQNNSLFSSKSVFKQQEMIKRLTAAQKMCNVNQNEKIWNKFELKSALGVARVANHSPSSPYPPTSNSEEDSRSTDSDSNFTESSDDTIKDNNCNVQMPLRRISWAFDYPDIQTVSNYDLSETKSFLRKRIRSGHIKPPEFVSMAVSAIHSNCKSSEFVTDDTRREQELVQTKRFDRPNSSPGRIDPRTMIRVVHNQAVRPQSAKQTSTLNSKVGEEINYSTILTSNVSSITYTPLVEQPIHRRRPQSEQNFHAKTHIPKAVLLRPHTSVSIRRSDNENTLIEARPQSSMIQGSGRTRSGRSCLSSPVQASIVPMRMYNRGNSVINDGNINKCQADKSGENNRKNNGDKVVQFPANDPFRYNTGFRLLTNQQLEHLMNTGSFPKPKHNASAAETAH